MSNNVVKISYFSDVLCVWAYIAQVRLEELKKTFQDKIEITPYHVTLFGDTEKRIARGWQDRGGYAGFGQHVLDVCSAFPSVQINKDVWKSCQPKSSGISHLFLKALQLYLSEHVANESPQQADEWLKRIEWEIRVAFFRDARDISDTKVLFDVAQSHSIDKNSLKKYLNDGSAMALFCSEMAMKEEYKLEGSPTYLLNHNRQKLFGNVGYKIMEANVAELINKGNKNQASWC